MMETLKNKFYALVLILVGIVATIVSGDATALVFLSAIAVPMFFAKKNWIY